MVTAAVETSDAVLTAAVIAHVGEGRALVDVLAVDVAVAFWAEFLEGGRARLGARVAGVAPGFADAAAADAPQVVTLQLLGADAVAVVEVAGLLALIDAPGGRLVQRQSRRAGAGEGSLRVDADAAALADARVQVALVDVRARLAVHFGVADRAVALDRVAHLARTAPGQADRAAALGFQRQTGQVVLAPAVHHFGPARTFAVI